MTTQSYFGNGYRLENKERTRNKIMIEELREVTFKNITDGKFKNYGMLSAKCG